jgi:NAD(P)-dependent dehydrogenase (short-subunit alcohol dehydrogenase family)
LNGIASVRGYRNCPYRIFAVAQNWSKTIVAVTGGASGIGEATVREFVERGATVAVIDRDVARGERVAAEAGKSGAARFFAADVSNSSEIAATVREIRRIFGPITVLAHSAGIQRYGTAVTTSEELWNEVLSVNVTSAFLMSQQVLPGMIEAGGGAIIHVGSVQSVGAVGNSTAYVTSKHALLGLVRSIALDFGESGVRCFCVCPGAIDTPMLRASAALDANPASVLRACERLHLFKRLGRPEEVARVIAFLASSDASFMTGTAVMVDGGCMVPIGGDAFNEEGTGQMSKQC